MRIDGQMLRNEMDLASLDGAYLFRVFIRQSCQFNENYSIGLGFLPSDEPGNICLFRCNGMHGGSKVHPHHLRCHIHRSIAEDLNMGLHVERHIETNVQYAAFLDALNHFLVRVNIQEDDLSTHFPNAEQISLFEGGLQS